MKKSLGVVLAATVGSFIAANVMADASPSAAPQSAEPNVKCMGANACKGQSACKTASNSCKGMNSCKGLGMALVASEKECTDKGGTIMKDDAGTGSAVNSSSSATSTTAPDQD